jgi:hypothetical protein
MVKVDLHADIAERCNEVGLVGFTTPTTSWVRRI